MIVDLVECEDPKLALSIEELTAGASKDIHGTGDQVARTERLKLRNVITSEDKIHNCLIALRPECLDQVEFDRLVN